MALLVDHFLDHQPESIREKLLAESSFVKGLDVVAHRVLGFAGVQMSSSSLLSAARKVGPGEERAIRVLGEGRAKIRQSADGPSLVIEGDRGELTVSFELLSLVAEDPQVRLKALDIVLEELGPTVDLRWVGEIAKERALSDDEAGTVLDVFLGGVATFQARIAGKLADGSARLLDLIPGDLRYFEDFCGPDPGDLGPDEYILDVLPEFRRRLLSRNLHQALEICFLGALRDDLYPSRWLADVDNDQLWDAMSAARPELDPVSLLAALDLSLYRQEDERFQGFADRAVGLLTADDFVSANGTKCYDLIPPLAAFVLNRIQLLEGGALRPPFWKRMCAWMQAALVVRRMDGPGIGAEKINEMVLQNLILAGIYANSVDLRREPMSEAGALSPVALRREVIGRLLFLRARHQAEGRSIPRSEDIDSAVGRLLAGGPSARFSLPGPLEGHHRPRTLGREELDEQSVDSLLQRKDDVRVGNLEYLSQQFAIPDVLREDLRRTLLPEPPLTPEIGPDRAWRASAVAAAERDTNVASAIAAALTRIAAEIHDEQRIGLMIDVLIRAAAAFEVEEDWAKWLGEQLYELANRLPSGNASAIFWNHIQELKKVTKLEVSSRAEAVASAGAMG